MRELEITKSMKTLQKSIISKYEIKAAKAGCVTKRWIFNERSHYSQSAIVCLLMGTVQRNRKLSSGQRRQLLEYHWINNWIDLVHMKEKAMTTHTSTLAWKIPWTEEPGRPQSMEFQRIGHDWVTSVSLFTLIHWRKKWYPTPVFLPGESQEWGGLVGYCLWDSMELDKTEAT